MDANTHLGINIDPARAKQKPLSAILKYQQQDIIMDEFCGRAFL